MQESWSNPGGQGVWSRVSESPPAPTCPSLSGSATESQPSAARTLRSRPTATKDQAPLNRSYKAGRRNLECHPAPEVKKQWLGGGPGFCIPELGDVRGGTLSLFLTEISSQHPRVSRACTWLDPGNVGSGETSSLSTIIS